MLMCVGGLSFGLSMYNMHNNVCVMLIGRLTKLIKWVAKECFLLGHCTCSLFVKWSIVDCYFVHWFLILHSTFSSGGVILTLTLSLPLSYCRVFIIHQHLLFMLFIMVCTFHRMFGTKNALFDDC